jgi:hypothetical protein
MLRQLRENDFVHQADVPLATMSSTNLKEIGAIHVEGLEGGLPIIREAIALQPNLDTVGRPLDACIVRRYWCWSG